jgi:hypothetical protein
MAELSEHESGYRRNLQNLERLSRDRNWALPLRLALREFRDNDNATWLIQRLGDRTPEQARHDQLSTAAHAA